MVLWIRENRKKNETRGTGFFCLINLDRKMSNKENDKKRQKM